MKLKVKTEKQVIKEKAKIEELMVKAIDKVNLLNRKQVEVLDQYKAILRHPCVDDLSYLIRILNKELKRYPEPLNNEIGGV
jgi:hypothetical protein